MELLDAVSSMPEASTYVLDSIQDHRQNEIEGKVAGGADYSLFASSPAVAVLVVDGGCDTSPPPLCRNSGRPGDGLSTTLVQVVRYDKEGNQACKRPLWLLVMGERRHKLTLFPIYQSYGCRFNLEHFFRFGKQKLCLASFQTPDVKREDTWWQLVHTAYAQLWMARSLAEALPPPWERNLPVMKRWLTSPTLVQRDFARIIRQLGTLARPPQHRGYSPGRRPGTRFPKSPHQKESTSKSGRQGQKTTKVA